MEDGGKRGLENPGSHVNFDPSFAHIPRVPKSFSFSVSALSLPSPQTWPSLIILGKAPSSSADETNLQLIIAATIHMVLDHISFSLLEIPRAFNFLFWQILLTEVNNSGKGKLPSEEKISNIEK